MTLAIQEESSIVLSNTLFSPSQNPLQFSLFIETLVGRACGKQIQPHGGCRQHGGKAGDCSETSSDKTGRIRYENEDYHESYSWKKLTLLLVLPKEIGRWLPAQTAVADLPPNWSRRCTQRSFLGSTSWELGRSRGEKVFRVSEGACMGGEPRSPTTTLTEQRWLATAT